MDLYGNVDDDRKIAKVNIALGAADIRWKQHHGPCEVPNGLTLCAIHHKVFDRGLISLDENMLVVVSDAVNGGNGRIIMRYDTVFHASDIRQSKPSSPNSSGGISSMISSSLNNDDNIGYNCSLRAKSAKPRLVSTAIVLTLHVPGRLDLIMNGTSAERSFSGLAVLCVTNQLNTIIAAMINVMILFMRFPFGVKYELLRPKGILIFASLRIL